MAMPTPIQFMPYCWRSRAGSRSIGTTPRQAMKPVNVARAPPNNCSRIRECTPSAPISTSPDAFAVFKQQRHAIRVLFEADAARADTHRIGRAFGQRLHQHRMKIAAMHQPVWRAVTCDGIGAEVLNAPGLAGVEQAHFLGRSALRQSPPSPAQAKSRQHARAVRRICTPAPSSRSSAACSYSATSKPRCSRASAATMPPIPAPAIRMRGLPKSSPLMR